MRRPSRTRAHSKIAVAALLSGLLSGCGVGDWFGPGEDPPLPGIREPVLTRASDLAFASDPTAFSISVGAERMNADWANQGGSPSHVNGALSLRIPFERVWSTSVGTGSGGARFLINQPVYAGGVIYVADAGGRVSAIDGRTGERYWRVVVADPQEDSTPVGGGVAVGEGLVYATTGFGEVLALDPANGGMVWSARASGPVRAAPTVAQGRVVVVTADGKTDVFDARTGAKAWDHQGITERSALLAGASPAVSAGVVISPYASGEFYALRIENGRTIWADSLSPTMASGAMSALPVIAGMPIVDNDLVVAISNGGRMAGVDMRSGARVWEQPIGGRQMPWLAGDTIFVVSNDGLLAALARNSGQVKWTTQLEQYVYPEEREGRITWTGPVLAGGSLILASDVGQGVIVSPQTGEITGRFETQPTLVSPVVADGTLFILGKDGTLVAYR